MIFNVLILSLGLLFSVYLSNLIRFKNFTKGLIISEESVSNVSLKRKDDKTLLGVSDNGIGMEDKYIEGKVESLGMKLVSELTKQIDGDMMYKRESGSHFTVTF